MRLSSLFERNIKKNSPSVERRGRLMIIFSTNLIEIVVELKDIIQLYPTKLAMCKSVDDYTILHQTFLLPELLHR